jgi:hypothetical protein
MMLSVLYYVQSQAAHLLYTYKGPLFLLEKYRFVTSCRLPYRFNVARSSDNPHAQRNIGGDR